MGVSKLLADRLLVVTSASAPPSLGLVQGYVQQSERFSYARACGGRHCWFCENGDRGRGKETGSWVKSESQMLM